MIEAGVSRRYLLALSSYALTRGMSFEAIVELTGLSPAEVVYPDGHIMAEPVTRLSRALLSHLPSVSVPLEFARARGPSVLGELLVEVQAAPTVGDAIELLCASASFFGIGFDFRLERGLETAHWTVSHPSDALEYGFGHESGFADLISVFRSSATMNVNPLCVSFPFAAKGYARAYEDHFGAPVSFEKRTERAGVVFRKADLEIGFHTVDQRRFSRALVAAKGRNGL